MNNITRPVHRKRSVEDFQRHYGEQEITLGAPLGASTQDPAPRRRRSGDIFTNSIPIPTNSSHSHDSTSSNSSPDENTTNRRTRSRMEVEDDDGVFAFGRNTMAQCLTRELNNLEPTGQQEVTQDIYGIDVPNAKVYFEPRDFEELQYEINRIEEKQEYLLAEQMSYAFVHNPKFRILPSGKKQYYPNANYFRGKK